MRTSRPFVLALLLGTAACAILPDPLEGESVVSPGHEGPRSAAVGSSAVWAAPLTAHASAAELLQESTASSSDADAELAQELANPLAELMTIPIQVNYDHDLGPTDDGYRIQTNIQPVVPFELTEDWNLITRTIVPVIHQDDIFPGEGSQFGLGDISASLFASPREPTESGVIWGVGPVLLLPTATDDLLGAEKWGAGPTAVALTMRGPWTMGVLANHVWSFAGEDDRADINNTFVQPFVAYTWPSAWTVSLQSETSYSWEAREWAVPLNLAASKLVRLGLLPVSFQAGVGYWLDSTENGPEGLRLRIQANVVLPKP